MFLGKHGDFKDRGKSIHKSNRCKREDSCCCQVSNMVTSFENNYNPLSIFFITITYLNINLNVFSLFILNFSNHFLTDKKKLRSVKIFDCTSLTKNPKLRVAILRGRLTCQKGEKLRTNNHSFCRTISNENVI